MEIAFTVVGIIGTLLLCVGSYLISFGDHKVSSIYFFFAGAVFLLLSAALYLHDHVKKEKGAKSAPVETKLSSSSAKSSPIQSSPTIVESPKVAAPTPLPTPTPLSPSEVVAE